MKKLISLIFVALISSQMWAYNFYIYYGNKSTMSSMGTISIVNVSGSKSGTGDAATISESLVDIYLIAESNPGYTFLGWKTSTSATDYISTDEIYKFYGNSSAASKYYAYFEAGKKATVTRETSGTFNLALPGGAVDMGLSVAWGKINLGASCPITAGGWYAWGETSPRGTTSSNKFDKEANYTAASVTTNLDASHDAATYTKGTGWRMPTKGEWEDLVTTLNTKNAYTGSNGGSPYLKYYYTITSKTTGNSIQIPLAGYNTSYSVSSDNSGCYYWSKTYKSVSPNGYGTKKSYYFKATTSAISTSAQSDQNCNYGMQIRPVYDYSNAGFTTYTLTINTGTSKKYVFTCKAGSPVTITPDAGTGYTFSSWTKKSGTNVTLSGNTFTLNSNAEYTANFVSSGYALAWDANGGSLTGGTAAGSVSGGTTITAPTATRTGYTFSSWNPAFTGTMPSANTTYTAQWTAKTYTADNNINGNGGNNGTYTATYDATSLTINTAPTREGHTLEGLYKEAGCTNKIANASGSLMANTAYTNSSSKWTNDGNVTLYAKWTVNNYTVTFKAADGTTTLQGPTNYSYGATITSCPIPVQQSGNTVFAGWTLNGNTSVVYTYEQIYNVMTVTGDMVFTAKYVPALSVTIPAFTNNGKVLVTANGTTYNVTSDGDEIYVANGSNVTIQAVPNAYYHFAAWEEDDQADDFIEYRPLNASVTYTPTWEQNVALPLVDTENEAYYTDLYTDAEYAGKMLTVTMTGRRLTEGSWMTFCAPFEFDIPAGHPMDGAVYRFINGTMTGTNTAGYISLDFVRTYKIEANVPYLVVAKTTTDTDLEFDGVTIEDAPEQKPVVASSGDVQFVSQPWKDALVNEALELADFYIASGNTLRYAKVGDPGTTIRAFRAYFHRLRDLNATPAPRRIVISLDGVETTKEIGVDGEIEDTTRKYMENGILYIERNGVRYDAQGQRAE